MATAILASGSAPRQGAYGTGLLTISEASHRFHVHPNTLRRMADSGRLNGSVYTLPSGHRRFHPEKLSAVLGVSEGIQSEGETGRIALLARVSSDGQGQGFSTSTGTQKPNATKESDLLRQCQRLQEYCREKYGTEGALYSDIGSGLNYERPNFVRLLTEIMEGRYRGGRVILTYKDRAVRFGFPLFELICKANGVAVEVLDSTVESGEHGELAEDIISICTHFGAVVSGRKAGKNCSVHLDPDAMERALELRAARYPVESIARILIEEGYLARDGRGKARKITNWVCFKDLKEGGKLAEVAVKPEDGETSFEVWAAKALVASEGSKTTAKDIWTAYTRWTEKEGMETTSKKQVGLLLKGKLGYTFYESNGRRIYRGVKVK